VLDRGESQRCNVQVWIHHAIVPLHDACVDWSPPGWWS